MYYFKNYNMRYYNKETINEPSLFQNVYFTHKREKQHRRHKHFSFVIMFLSYVGRREYIHEKEAI